MGRTEQAQIMQMIREDPELKKAYHERCFSLNQKFVFFEDFANSLYRERNVVGYSKTCTTIELAQSVLARVLSFLNRNCQMYFICCDIGKHVPVRKHATQEKRKFQQQKSDKQPYPANCVLHPDGISVWGAAPQHIEIDRMAITPYLRYAFLSWLRDNIKRLNFPVPSGKCLVLDFDKEGPVTFCNGELRRWPAYAHGCGEYDSMGQFYTTLFLRHTGLSVVLSTADSDVLINMLWTIEDMWPEIVEKKDQKVIWYSPVANEKKGAWVDLRMLHEKTVEYMLKRNPDAKKPVFPVDKSKPQDRSEQRNAIYAFILATSLCGADCTVEKAFLSYQVPFYASPDGRASTQKKKKQKQQEEENKKKKGSKGTKKGKAKDTEEEEEEEEAEKKEEKEDTEMDIEPGDAPIVANDRKDVISVVRRFLHLVPFCHLVNGTEEQRWRDEYYPSWPLPPGWSKQPKLSGTMSLQNPLAPPTAFQALDLIMEAIRALKPTRSAHDDRVKARLKKQQTQLDELEQLIQEEDNKKLQVQLRAMRAEQRVEKPETKGSQDKDGDAQMDVEPATDGKDEKKSSAGKGTKAKSSIAQVEERPNKRRKVDKEDDDATESKEGSEDLPSVDERLAKLLKDNGIVLVTEEQIRAQFPTAEEAMNSVLFDAAYLTPAMSAFAPGPFDGLHGGELIA